jgi:hypothetical protein
MPVVGDVAFAVVLVPVVPVEIDDPVVALVEAV